MKKVFRAFGTASVALFLMASSQQCSTVESGTSTDRSPQSIPPSQNYSECLHQAELNGWDESACYQSLPTTPESY